MMRSTGSVLALLLLVWPALAGAQSDTNSGTIAAATDSVVVRADNHGAGTIQARGTWVGTLRLQCKVLGGTLTTVPLNPVAGGAAVTVFTGNGTWLFYGGFTYCEVNPSAWTSGTAIIDTLATSAKVGGSGASSLSNPVTPAQGGTGQDFSGSTGVLYDAAGTFSAIPCASGIFQGGAPPTCTTTPALGTPASGVGTNLTGTAAALSIGGSAGSLGGATFGAPGAIGGTTPGTAQFTRVGIGEAPDAVRTLAITGPSGDYAALIKNTSAAGSSFGLQVWGGGNSADYALRIYNRGGVTPLFDVRGDGLASFAGSLVGGGYLELPEQTAPATPTNALRFFADSSNRFSWKGENGFVRTFDGSANTADRVYTLPDVTDTIVTLAAAQNLAAKTFINTSAAAITFGTSSTEQARVLLGFMVGTTTDPGAGIINVATGFRVANGAGSGRVLRGDGTNFVSTILAASDLSNNTTGIGTVVLSTSPTIVGGGHTAMSNLGLRDTAAGFDLTLASTSSTTLTAGRTLTFDVVNAARTLKLTGNPTLADWFDQSVKTTATPTFTRMGINLAVHATRPLVVGGPSGDYTAVLDNSATASGSSFGLSILAGGNSSDIALNVLSNTATSNVALFKVRGDGAILLPQQPSASGVRYVCIDTTGKLVSQAAVCSGT